MTATKTTTISLIHRIPSAHLPWDVTSAFYYLAYDRDCSKIVFVRRAVTDEDIARHPPQGAKVGEFRWFAYESDRVAHSHTGRTREMGYLDVAGKGTRLHTIGNRAEYGGFRMRQIAANFASRSALLDLFASDAARFA